MLTVLFVSCSVGIILLFAPCPPALLSLGFWPVTLGIELFWFCYNYSNPSSSHPSKVNYEVIMETALCRLRGKKSEANLITGLSRTRGPQTQQGDGPLVNFGLWPVIFLTCSTSR